MASETREPARPCRAAGQHQRLIGDRVGRIISQLLGIDPALVGGDLSFMELGADSITFTDIIFKIEAEFNIQVPVEKFFDELATVADLVQFIENQPVAPAAIAPKDLTTPLRGQSFALAERQKDTWLLSQMSPAGHLSDVEAAVLRLKTAVDPNIMQAAIQQVADRHEALRTAISEDGETQTVLAKLPLQLEQLDFTYLKAEGREREIVQWIRQQRVLAFDFRKAPLWRAAILKTAPREYLLVLIVHHILFDGLSFEVFFAELVQIYTATADGASPCLPQPLQFHEYLARETARRTRPGLAEQEKFWQTRLADPPPVAELPLDAARPPAMTYRGACHGISLDRELSTALQRLSRRSGVTLFTTLLAGYVTFLHRITGRQDLIVGLSLARRSHDAARRMIGYGSDMAALRSRITGNIAFTELLQNIKRTLVEIFKNQDYPFSRVYKTFAVPDPGRNGLLTSMITLQRATRHDDMAQADLEIAEKATTHSNLDFSSNMIATGERLRVQFIFNPDLFHPETVARWMGHFNTMLADIVQSPHKPVYGLSLLTEAEKRQIVGAWNSTRKDYPLGRTFAQLFESQVRRTPAAVALISGAETVTYAACNARANRLARALRKRGVKRGMLVALMGERNQHFVTGMLAIFKLGAVYLPLDPRFPARRLAAMVRQSQTPFIVLTSSSPEIAAEIGQRLKTDMPPVFEMQKLPARDLSDKNLELAAGPADLAYVMFTSGSTGTPKGAMVKQAGMINHLHCKIDDLALTDADVVAHMAPQGFDISVWQYLAALLVGAQVHIFPDSVAFDPFKHLEALGQAGITIYQTVPSVLQQVIHTIEQNRYLAPPLPRLRWVVPTGEALPPEICRRWLRYYPHIPMLNAYGPTECSDDVAHHRIEWPPLPGTQRIPIGKPNGNTQLYVLDAYHNPVPIGVVGELYIGGIGVGAGYLHDAARTARAFIPNPFQAPADAGARLYKTGDLARYLPDGVLEFVGRIDQQVQIRGIRIEPAEVQNNLLDFPNVLQAAVLVQSLNNSEPQLVGYIVCGSRAAPSVNALRRFLKDRLPQYMIPQVFVQLEALPLNHNGKLDRSALPDPATAALTLENDFVRPRSTTENYLFAVWQAVLQHEFFGVEDDIFDVTDSLQAIRIAGRIAEDYRIYIPAAQMFRMATIARIAQHLDQTLDQHPAPPDSPAP